jgi:DNA-binding transcriptional LysR family regulator
VFLPFARALVRQKEQAQRALAAASAVPHEELRIGICDEVPLKQLARLLALYRAAHPTLDIHIVELPCETLILDLQSGALDIGFSLGSPEEPNIEARPLWTHDAVAIVPADPKSTEIESIDISELSKSRIVLGHRQCGCGTKSRMDSLLRSVAAKPSIKDAGSFNIIRTLVDAGDGVGIVSAAQAERMAVIRMRYIPLNEGEGMFTTHLLRNADQRAALFRAGAAGAEGRVRVDMEAISV